MTINEWLAAIQEHKFAVIAGAILLLAFLIFFIRNVRKNPLKTMFAFTAACLILTGIVTIQSFFEITARVREAHNWPKTQGLITLSKTYESTENRYTDRKVREGKTKVTIIEYQYRVLESEELRTYKSNLVHLSNRPVTSSYSARFPAGKSVTVYYNPQNPPIAVLELESTASFVGLFMGIVLEMIAVIMLVVVVRKKQLLDYVPRRMLKTKPN